MSEHFEILFAVHGEAWEAWFQHEYAEALKAANCADLAEWHKADQAGMLAFFGRADFLGWVESLPQAPQASKRL